MAPPLLLAGRLMTRTARDCRREQLGKAATSTNGTCPKGWPLASMPHDTDAIVPLTPSA